jgi:hypothetical protein
MAVLLEMNLEACQDLSWHRAVAETDETPFWPACSQSDGPAPGGRRDNREKKPATAIEPGSDARGQPRPVGVYSIDERPGDCKIGQVQDAGWCRQCFFFFWV